MSEYYIGLISGTSMDGIDAVLVDFSDNQPTLVASLCHPYPDKLRSQLKALCDEKIKTDEVNAMGRADIQTAQSFADAANALLEKANFRPKQITAIGSHGQTIRHYPDGEDGFTIQIGDPNTLAVLTGIDVIADFRRKDIALGGEGAPMVPAFHKAVFASPDVDRIIVNLGGIANLTYLPKDSEKTILGYDTGPANTLSDQWIQYHSDQSYDANGQWAAGGECMEDLLKQMLKDEYFARPAPKSTGREKFSLSWLKQFIDFQTVKPQNVQKTLIALSAHSLADEIQKLCQRGEIYLCGGGSLNAQLVDSVKSLLPNFKVNNTNALGVDPNWVEAMAFSYLARAFMLGVPGNIPSVTGAKRPAVLGCRYFAK